MNVSLHVWRKAGDDDVRNVVGPRSIALSVDHEGNEVAARTLSPEYIERQPWGDRCGTCEEAPLVSVELPAQ